MTKRSLCLTLSSLVLLQVLLLGWSARVHSPTWDETGHLAAGISHWELGRFDLYSVNPPLVRTVAAAGAMAFDEPKMDWDYYRSDPTMRTEVLLGRRMMQLNGEESISQFFWARIAVIPIALLGTLFCFLWGRALYGDAAGLLAAFLWVFSPMVLAYGAVITPDLASAVALLGATYFAYKWFANPTWSLALCLSGALAIAMLSKSVWLILPMILVAAWLAYGTLAYARKRFAGGTTFASFTPGQWWVQAFQIGVISAGALLLVNAFYGFQGSLTPLGEFEFVSQTLAGPPECVDCGWQRGNRFEESVLAGFPVPLPANYVAGIDIQRRDFESGLTNPAWQSYLFGKWQQGGWWYYYLVGLWFKIPVITWILVAAGTLTAVLRKTKPETRLGTAVLVVPALAFLVLLSVNTGLNRYVRYALPILPVLLIWASQLAAYRPPMPRLAGGMLASACGLLAIVSISNAPHWLSFFNMAAGGPAGGHNILCDSNVDWGQDLIELKSWLAEHPEAEQDLHMAAFSSYDPVVLGIDYDLPPKLNADFLDRSRSDQSSQGPRPGWYAISKNYLVGHSMPVPDSRDRMQFKYFGEPVFAYFNEFEPVASIGNSMLVFNLETAEVEKVRTKLGLAPLRARGMLVGSQELTSTAGSHVATN